MKLLVITQELHVCATTFKTFLELDLILYNQSLARIVDCRGELRRDGVVSSRVFDNQAFVAWNARKNLRLFNRPFSNVCPVLISLGVLLLSMRWCPS